MKSKHICPSCGQNKKFTRYIDTETNEYIDYKVGRCDRSDNCSYHYKPIQYFTDNKYLINTFNRKTEHKSNIHDIQKVIAPSFISFETFKFFLEIDFEKNNFNKYLIRLFGNDASNKLIENYFISTSQIWEGATIFWQIDKNYKIRSGKIMLYDFETGKRNKTKNNWVHKVLNLTTFQLNQCFFGEHLLNGNFKTVAVVESEKTAVIMSYFLPEFVWLGCGGKEGLNTNKFKILKGRNVILFPDLSKNNLNNNCYQLWSKKANEYKSFSKIIVSDFLERHSTDFEKKAGFDLADFFIKLHLKQKMTNFCF